MKQKYHKIAKRIPCQRCDETGNANWQHPHRPYQACNHCNGLGWVVAKPRALRKQRKTKGK